MRNWRTTLIGALLAGLSFLAIYQANGGNLGDWKQWLIPVLIASLGYVAKDAGVVGSVKALGLLLMCGMLLTSCGVTREQWTEIGKGVLLREGAVVYGQVQSARAVNAAAKNPVKVVPGG